jgi:hypothetical protein
MAKCVLFCRVGTCLAHASDGEKTMPDLPEKTDTLTLPLVREKKLKTEDEFTTKVEAVDYYRTYFLNLVFTQVPEVFESLKGIYLEFKRLTEQEQSKEMFKDFSISERLEWALSVYFVHFSPAKYLKMALPAWAKKYRIPICEGSIVDPIYRKVSIIIGDWYAHSQAVGGEDFLETMRTPFPYAYAEINLAKKNLAVIPTELNVIRFEWDYAELWPHVPIKKNDIENHIRGLFEKRLSEWLEAREKSGYFETMTSKKKRIDGRRKSFEYLAHYMVLRKHPEHIAEEFGVDEKTVRRDINKACKILEFDRKALELPRGRKKKGTI